MPRSPRSPASSTPDGAASETLPSSPPARPFPCCFVTTAAPATPERSRWWRRRCRPCTGAGMYDHVGGGFARYSTDERWLVPHFEKMLYDNAQLTKSYLAAFQVTGKEEYRTVAAETLDYILREMVSPEGRDLLVHRRRLRRGGGEVLRLHP